MLAEDDRFSSKGFIAIVFTDILRKTRKYWILCYIFTFLL